VELSLHTHLMDYALPLSSPSSSWNVSLSVSKVLSNLQFSMFLKHCNVLWFHLLQIVQYSFTVHLRFILEDALMWSITVITLSFFLGWPHFSPADQSGQYLISFCLYTTFFMFAIEISILKSRSSGCCIHQWAVDKKYGMVSIHSRTMLIRLGGSET